MDVQELRGIVRENGVVGAGGAGFPSYMKIDERTEVILLNCAECEPLLKLHRQLLEKHAYRILEAFHMVADAVSAKEAVIGIKKEYKATVRALETYVDEFEGVRIQLLDSVYPAGDEVVMIYEATGRVVRPGGLPIEQGVTVFNVETMYNIWRAAKAHRPVTDKLVSVAAEVNHPVTVRVPLGCSIEEVVALAGGSRLEDPVYFIGGPMMGRIGAGKDLVTKTTNAVLVLPGDHLLVQKKNRNPSIDMKRAASACCQCQMCSDLCPRHALGHPVAPHTFMRAAANRDFRDTETFVNTLFCSSCGLCELYACPQSLSPRALMADYKDGIRKAGVRPPVVEAVPVKQSREYRKVPEERLEARLGLAKYNVEAPLMDEVKAMKRVKIPLSQHIGVPARTVVKRGDMVEQGQMIGAPAEGLSVAVHASIGGRVTGVTDSHVVIWSVETDDMEGKGVNNR